MFHPIFIINIQNFILWEIIHVQIISHTYYLL